MLRSFGFERVLGSLLAMGMTIVGLAMSSAAPAWSSNETAEAIRPLLIAQATGSEAEADEGSDRRPLEPRYQPREPEERSWYNGSYLFGMTRGVAGSTMAPAAKVPLFVLTIPLDIVLLPFAAIGGLFG